MMRHVGDFGALSLRGGEEEKWRRNGDSRRCEGEDGRQEGEKWRQGRREEEK